MLTANMLILAYQRGLFPMGLSHPDDNGAGEPHRARGDSGSAPSDATRRRTSLSWHYPDPRGILPLDRFHTPRRLRRTLRQALQGDPARIRVTLDRAFDRVLGHCAFRDPDSMPAHPFADDTQAASGTWINAELHTVYRQLHQRGLAHSIEIWHEDDLCGGLFGVHLGGAFFGESMFSTRRDASKIALVCLAALLRRGGFQLLDTQFVTPHLENFGALWIEADRYMELLDAALAYPGQFPTDFSAGPVLDFLQLSSQIS